MWWTLGTRISTVVVRTVQVFIRASACVPVPVLEEGSADTGVGTSRRRVTALLLYRRAAKKCTS